MSCMRPPTILPEQNMPATRISNTVGPQTVASRRPANPYWSLCGWGVPYWGGWGTHSSCGNALSCSCLTEPRLVNLPGLAEAARASAGIRDLLGAFKRTEAAYRWTCFVGIKDSGVRQVSHVSCWLTHVHRLQSFQWGSLQGYFK